MTAFPILFTYRDLVAGEGFLVGVETKGRVLLEQEDESSFWALGVNPGCISADAESARAALEGFRSGWTAVLYSVAAETGSIEAFQAEVRRLFEDSSDEDLWAHAVAAVREGKVSGDGLLPEGLPTKPAESRRGVRFKDFTLEMNADANPDPYDEDLALAKCA